LETDVFDFAFKTKHVFVALFAQMAVNWLANYPWSAYDAAHTTGALHTTSPLSACCSLSVLHSRAIIALCAIGGIASVCKKYKGIIATEGKTAFHCVASVVFV